MIKTKTKNDISSFTKHISWDISLLKNNNFLNNKNYTTSNKNEADILKFYFSIKSQQDPFFIFSTFFSAFLLVGWMFYYSIFIGMAIWDFLSKLWLWVHPFSFLLYVIFVIVIIFYFTMKWINFMWYHLINKGFFVKYNWFYTIKHLKEYYFSQYYLNNWTKKMKDFLKDNFIVLKK